MVLDLRYHFFKSQMLNLVTIYLGVYSNLFVHVDNRIKDILILGRNPADGLNGTKITNIMDIVKNKESSVNTTKSGKKICLSIH